MNFDDVFKPFIDESPVSVMFRGVLENVFSSEKLDAIFQNNAERQYESELLFSTCADMMALVVAGTRKSVNAAYRAMKDELTVSVNSVYNKLAGVEPRVSECLVRDTATDLATVIGEMNAEVKGPIPGYDVRILDGNHLAGTEHRIKELRGQGAAALPGHGVAILNPQTKLIEDVALCEDGHANERTLLPELLQRVNAKQCWIGDTNFCTLAFLFGIAQRRAYFVIRQHGSLQGQLIGRRKKIGRGDTGMIYEQTLRLEHRGQMMDVRRITIVRDEPTEKGQKEVHVLTNLPAKVSAKRVAQAYRDRWLIETAFGDLATTLRGELNTLGYPDAALFGFCVALVLHNVLSTMKAALRVAAGGEKKLERNLSSYYLADEISGVWRGMAIAIPAEHWTEAFGSLTPRQLAKHLLWLAKRVDLRSFYTNPWSPKRPPPQGIPGKRGSHFSTHRVLLHRVPARK